MSRTILIVDDEAHLRMLIQQTLEELEDEGVELITASNGEEALARIQEARPQLVFLDVMMPKLSGFDICQRAKKDLGLTDVHIVLLTAKGQSIRCPVNGIRETGRGAKGVRLVTLEPGDKLLSIARIVETDEEQAAGSEVPDAGPAPTA